MSPENIDIDLHSGALFRLYTLTDDNPGEQQTESVTISINVSDGEKVEVVVTGFRVGSFSSVDIDEKINEICEFIKNNIIISLSTVPFGVITPKVMLWD